MNDSKALKSVRLLKAGRASCPTVWGGGKTTDVGGKPRPTESASVASDLIFGHGSSCAKIGEVTL